MVKGTRHDFTVASMKKLALRVFNDELFQKKDAVRAEIIDDYNQNEGKAVLDEVQALDFDSRRMKTLKGLARRLANYEARLRSADVTEADVKAVCKEISINYQEKYEGQTDISLVAADVASIIFTSSNANAREIKACAEKKLKHTQLMAKYLAERKPIMCERRKDYRKVVACQRELRDNNPELLKLKEERKGQKGEEAKATKAKIEALKTKLHEELKQRVVDPKVISELLVVDPLIAQRYAFIFAKRQLIDELSASCLRVAKLGEVLSVLSERLTIALLANTRQNIFSARDRNVMTATLHDLRGMDKSLDGAIVLASFSEVKNAIDTDKTPVFVDEAKEFATPIKKIINQRMGGLKWEKDAREALYSIVYESLIGLARVFKSTITGQAKTISRTGITDALRVILVSHRVPPTEFDAQLDAIFKH